MPEPNFLYSSPFPHAVFRELPGLYLILDTDFTVLDATDAYLRTSHSPRQRILNQNILNLIPDNSHLSNINARQELKSSLEHVLINKEKHTIPLFRFDIALFEEEGGGYEERFWTTTNKPVFDNNGNISHIILETCDMTNVIQKEQENQRTQEQLFMLTGAIHAVSWEYDIVRDQMMWGPRLEEVFGYTPEDMGSNGDSWDSRVHPDDYAQVQETIEQANSNGSKIWTGEYRFRKADGTYAHVLDQGYIIYDNKNEAVRTIGSIIDLSESRQAEQDLKESDARFLHLIEVLPHMAWTAEPSGKILHFNQNWYSFTGMPEGQTEGWISVIHPEDSAAVLTAWYEALASGQTYEIEYRILNYLENEYKWFLERGVPMHDENGNIKLWFGTYTDIDDQKQALEKLQLKDQQLQEILNLSPAHLCLLQGPDHICRFVTPGVYTMYGNRQYLGRPAAEIWPELGEIGFPQLLDQVYTQGNTVNIDGFRTPVNRDKSGKVKDAYFNFRYQPLPDSNGKPEGILISAVEVTELVLAKREAEALAKKLQHNKNL
ncbi:PAS domain-containing protein [Pontibacter vulgaris]|uniref:PAS domain-containing protein n=1 Tax=Pontibacter vulgaris TaxID=2905679 RepID=UPI001FA7AB49|nr:PAS domain-containing protein [Pontibacter vulgaris]